MDSSALLKDLIQRSSSGADDVAIVDQGDAKSVFNMLPESSQGYLNAVPAEVWDLSISELTREIKPSLEMRKLRIAFWIEYERACRTNTAIVLANVTKGIVSTGALTKTVFSDCHKLAYLLTPPEDYKVRMEEMLQLALDEERKILELPAIKKTVFIKKDGESVVNEEVDTKIAMVKHKIRESLQNRLQGMPVARTHNINENRGGDGDEPTLEEMSDKDLEKYVEELQKRKAGPIIDISGDGA